MTTTLPVLLAGRHCRNSAIPTKTERGSDIELGRAQTHDRRGSEWLARFGNLYSKYLQCHAGLVADATRTGSGRGRRFESTIRDVCVPECPNDAITAGNPNNVIDPLKCTERVGAKNEPQCRPDCPVCECIVVKPHFVETPEQLQGKFQGRRG